MIIGGFDKMNPPLIFEKIIFKKIFNIFVANLMMKRIQDKQTLRMNNDFLTSAFKRLRSRLHLDSDDEEDADIADALQDAFCRLWTRRDTIQCEAHAEGALMTATRNIRLDDFRKKSCHPEASLSEINNIPDNDDAEDDASELYNAVNRLASQRLSLRDREILFHREKDGWEFHKLAEEYHLSEANVRLIVSRSRKALRELYLKQKHF